MLVGDTLRSYEECLTVARREETAEHRAQTYHSLVLRGKLRSAVRWITERETGGVLHPRDRCKKTGGRVLEVLCAKQQRRAGKVTRDVHRSLLCWTLQTTR